MLKLIKRLIVLNLMLVGAAKIAAKVLPDTRDTEADEFELTSILAESNFVTTANSLVSGNITTLYGATVIDLRGAELSDAGATLNVNTAFGATEIIVPEGWNVVIETTSVAAAIENKTASDSVSSATLRISGYTVLGALSVSS